MPLSTLPTDIYISICCFLEPLDVLALEQTCSNLCAVRSIWISALKYASSRSQIFSRTFKYGSMSLEELKHAATASQRMLSKLHKGSPIDTATTSPAHLSPHSTFQIRASDLDNSESSDIDDSDEREFRRIYLIPGGRFLIAFSINDHVIYDLMSPDPSDDNGGLLRVAHGLDFAFLSCPSPDKQEVRLLSGNKTGAQGMLCVFSIAYGDSESPPSIVRYSMDLTDEQRSIGERPYTMVGDLVLFIYSNRERRYVMSVWNYIDDTVANWIIPFAHYEEVFMHNNYVCVVTEDAINLWPLPTLKSRGRARALEPQYNIVASHILLAPTYIPMGSCGKLADWYNTFDSPTSFDFLATASDDHLLIKYKTPPASLNGHTFSASERLDFVASKVGVRGASNTYNASSYALCHGYTVKPFMLSDGRIFIATEVTEDHPIASIDSGACRDVIVELHLPESAPPCISSDELRIKRWDFCFDPMSGRLAYLSEDLKSITIVDYLRRPSKSL